MGTWLQIICSCLQSVFGLGSLQTHNRLEPEANTNKLHSYRCSVQKNIPERKKNIEYIVLWGHRGTKCLET